MTELTEWGSFYSIIGTGAATLIGILFVILTLISNRPIKSGDKANAAFSTPTIVHFSIVLLLSALMRVPWQTIFPLTVLLKLIGFCGVLYILIVARRMKNQKVYQTVFYDWLFHFIFPLISYLILLISAFSIMSCLKTAFIGVGTTAIILLFIGIHNAWDTVTYHVFNRTNN
jgi:hypothetical protein